MQSFFLFVALLALSNSSVVASSDDIDDFDDFADFDLEALLNVEVFTASQKSETLSDAPAVIEVIDAVQLKRWQSRTLYEALERIAGTEVIENYFGYVNINVRGVRQPLYNNKILLLIDGVPVFEAANGSFHLEQVPIASVERIEVIRGPGAVLYGTNAFAGVISVITKTPDDTNVDAQIWGGAPFSGGMDLSSGHRWGTGYIQVSLQGLQSQKWTARVPADESGVAGTYQQENQFASLLLKGQQEINKNNKLRLLFGMLRQKKSKMAMVPDLQFESLPNDIGAEFIDLEYSFNKDNIGISSSFTFLRNDRDQRLGVVSAVSPEKQTLFVHVQTYRASVAGHASISTLRIKSGIQYLLHKPVQYESLLLTSRALSPLQGSPLESDTTASDLNAFAQASWTPHADIDLGAGFRYNLFQAERPIVSVPKPEAKHTASPQASLVVRVIDEMTMKLLYGRAFRVPSLFELYTDAPIVVVGDPNLSPETVDTVEVAFDARPISTLSLRVDSFMNFSRDGISRTVNALGASVYRNDAKEWTRGVEASVRWLPVRQLDVLATGGYQLASTFKNGNYKTKIDEVARVLIVGSATGMFYEKWINITPQVRYIGKRAGLDPVTLFHLFASSEWRNYTLSIATKNITDKRYAVPELQRGVITQGLINNAPRSLELSLEATF